MDAIARCMEVTYSLFGKDELIFFNYILLYGKWTF